MEDLHAFIESSDFSKEPIAEAEKKNEESSFLETTSVNQADAEITDASILMAMRDIIPSLVQAETTNFDEVYNTDHVEMEADAEFSPTSFLEVDEQIEQQEGSNEEEEAEAEEEEQDFAFLEAENAPEAGKNGYEIGGWAGPIINPQSFEGKLMTRGHYFGYPHAIDALIENARYQGYAPSPFLHDLRVPVAYGVGPVPPQYINSPELAGIGLIETEADADDEVEVDAEADEEMETEEEEPSFLAVSDAAEEEEQEQAAVDADAEATLEAEDTPLPRDGGESFNNGGSEGFDGGEDFNNDSKETPPPPPPSNPPNTTTPVEPPKNNTPPVDPPTNTTTPIEPPKNNTPPVEPPKNTTTPVEPPKNDTKPVEPPKNNTTPVAPKPKRVYVGDVEYKARPLKPRFYPFYSRENGYNADKHPKWNAKVKARRERRSVYQEPIYLTPESYFSSSRSLNETEKEKLIYNPELPELPRLYPANMPYAHVLEPYQREIVTGMFKNGIKKPSSVINRLYKNIESVVRKVDGMESIPEEQLSNNIYKDVPPTTFTEDFHDKE